MPLRSRGLHVTTKDTGRQATAVLLPLRAEPHVGARCVLRRVFHKQRKRAMRWVCAMPYTKASPFQISLTIGCPKVLRVRRKGDEKIEQDGKSGAITIPSTSRGDFIFYEFTRTRTPSHTPSSLSFSLRS